jgi:phosphotransferase system HPr-like phosphotransfer protein
MVVVPDASGLSARSALTFMKQASSGIESVELESNGT